MMWQNYLSKRRPPELPFKLQDGSADIMAYVNAVLLGGTLLLMGAVNIFIG